MVSTKTQALQGAPSRSFLPGRNGRLRMLAHTRPIVLATLPPGAVAGFLVALALKGLGSLRSDGSGGGLRASREPYLAGRVLGWTTALVLMLQGCNAGAANAPASPPERLSLPTLVYPLGTPLGSHGLPLEMQAFRATALQDLANSKEFSLLDPGAAPAGAEEASSAAWKAAGARYLLRIRAKALREGRVQFEGQCVDLATGRVVLKKSLLGGTRAVQRMAHRLVDVLVEKITGTRGVADSTIVFARQTTPGIQEIFSMDRDGGSLRQMTFFGSLSTHPAISGDGKLALVTYKGGPPELWGQTQPQGPGKRLYPESGTPGLGLSDLAWSPDGKRLAFVQADHKGDMDVYVLELQSNRAIRLTQGGHSNTAPCWNPQGTELAYVSDRAGTPQVFLMGSDGSHVRPLTTDAAPKECVAWNASGDRIAYSSRFAGASHLFTSTPGGADRRQVLSSAAAITSLCWAPDGRWLLLGLKQGRESRLRLASLDGSTQDFPGSLGSRACPQWLRKGLQSSSLDSLTLADRSALPPEPGPLEPRN